MSKFQRRSVETQAIVYFRYSPKEILQPYEAYPFPRQASYSDRQEERRVSQRCSTRAYLPEEWPPELIGAIHLADHMCFPCGLGRHILPQEVPAAAVVAAGVQRPHIRH